MFTWGQIRFQIKQGAPNAPDDLVQEFINTRYARILDHMGWQGLEGRAYIETTATYRSSTDTVAVTQGDASIIGTGTTWTGAITSFKFQAEADGPYYAVTFVDPTHATLDRPYEAATQTAIAYSFFANVYALPLDCKAVLSIESADDGFRLEAMNQVQMGDSVGFRDESGSPAVYSFVNASDGTPQVELFPFPATAKGYPVIYQRGAAGFDGTNLAAGPLGFVPDAAILAGVRSDLAAIEGKIQQVAIFERMFANELAAMVRAEVQRQPRVVLKPARWMTRHRIARVMRNSFPRIPN